MARVFEYMRSVDALTIEGHNKEPQFLLEDETLNRIKEEPSNACDEETPISSNKDNTKHKSNNTSKNNYNSNKKTVCCSSEIMKSRKRKRHERHSVGDIGDLNNTKALQENNYNIESCKRYKKARSREVTRKLNMKKQTTVHCKICFLKFRSMWGLYHHKRCFERKQQQKSLTVVRSSRKLGKIACNFCSRHFRDKDRVQGHLFHVHMSDLSIDLKKNVLSDKLCNSQSYTSKKQIMRQTTLLEYMFPPEKSKFLEITNNSNNSYVHSQAIIKQEIDLNDNGSDLSISTSFVDTSLQNEVSSEATIPNKPFVKIHVNSNIMKVLLGIDPNDSTKPSENNSKNNSNNNEVYDVRSPNSLQELSNEELPTVVNKTNQTNIVEKLKDRDLLNICKKCSVPLVRCDDKPITKLTLQCSTPSAQIVGQNNSTSLKPKRQQLRSMNVTITPILDTPRKVIPKDSSSTNSTPKGILSSTTPSKATIHDLYVRSNLNKQLANRRSSSTKIVPNVEEKISSEQTNAADLEASSPEEESNLTNIQSTQPTTEFKLKELRVSLIKLPTIKKEFHEPTIYYCEHCELPFSSERRKDKHIRKIHTTYISSICTARCNSKRSMLKHYLQEHCIWGCDRCCVCRQFFRSRLSLKGHLLLHCIKITVSKNERCPNMTTKCNVKSKIRRRRKVYPMKRQEIADIRQENVNANNVENIPRLDDKPKDNDNETVIDHEQQAHQVDEATREMENSLETNAIFLSSNDYEAMELSKEPVLDPLSITNDSSINQNDTQSTLTPNSTTVSLSVSNDKPVSMPPSIEVNRKQKYPCSICGKQFQKLEGLWQHKRTYTQSFQNFCTTCGLCFSNKKILRNHINSTHDFYLSNLFKHHCQFCNQGFRSDANLRIHELHYHAAVETTGKQKVAELLKVSYFKNSSNNTDTMCNVCKRNFNSYERYQLHCMYYHKGHVFACHICGQIFQGLYMLHRHNKLHHYPESTRLSYTYNCPICYEGFGIESHLLGHMAHIHPSNTPNVSPNQTAKSSKKSYICSKCHLEFSTIMELMVHVEHYTDGGNFKCQQCPRKCCTLAVLNEHINLNHGIRLRNDCKCSLCNEVLVSTTSLLCHKKHVHQYVETSENLTFVSRISGPGAGRTQSDIYNKEFPVIAGPENQLGEPQIHTSTSVASVSIWGKCNISCPICGLTFDTELFLKKHLTEYLDVGDYKCEMCQRRFANYEFLGKHIANHWTPSTPQSKYYCSVCNENFQSSIVYESHVAHLHASLITTDTSP